uniref:Uncharacterized protein LOC104234977 n=1 Tax=Nicotiana sylvestris TaxID=4096 RepID=A0A1U7XKC3_NICSY|nr:PREDICTED: uncharacterized protein LOC104234977 [Nicotiana sylvestris]
MWYVLEEQDALESINHAMSHLEEGNTAQNRRDLETYNIWKKKDSNARGIIISSVADDLIHKCEQYPTAQAMWAHLREHVQAVIRSLPNNWEHLKVNLNYNDNIKIFADVALHVELEDEWVGAAKTVPNAFVVESSSTKRLSFKHKRNWKNDRKGMETGEGPSEKRNKPNSKKGKQLYKKKDKSKMKCYNCQVLGHFAREWTELKKVAFQNASLSAIYVSSTILLTESYLVWNVDSGSTDHVSRDREVFVEFRRVSPGSKHVYVGNNAKLEVKGICTCIMDMRGGRSLMLHDVMYVPEI